LNIELRLGVVQFATVRVQYIIITKITISLKRLLLVVLRVI